MHQRNINFSIGSDGDQLPLRRDTAITADRLNRTLLDANTHADRLPRAFAMTVALSTVVMMKLAVFLTGTFAFDAAVVRHTAAPHAVAWVNFDGSAYRDLALHGYPGPTTSDPAPIFICFFPLYPLLTRLLLPMLPVNAAMLVISNLASIIGFIFFFRWCKKITDDTVALFATIVLAAWPGAVFFQAALTESLFFLSTALALWSAADRKFFHAAIASSLACLTRPTGLAVALTIIALCVRSEQQRGTSPGRRWLKILGISLLSISGSVLYQLYLVHRYHSLDVYFQAQKHWVPHVPAGRPDTILSVSALSFYLQRLMTPQVWNRGMMLVLVGIIAYGLLRQTKVPRLYFLLPLVIFILGYGPNLGARASSVIRFETAGLPCFLITAYWLQHHRRWLCGLCAGMFALQMYYACLFARDIWIG